MAMEYTQKYIVGPEDIAPAPLGLQPQGPDMPGTVPEGYVPTGPDQQSGINIAQVPQYTGPAPTRQYAQRYPEGYVPPPQSYIGGLRGNIRALQHIPLGYREPNGSDHGGADWSVQPTYGPILETNRGYPWTYLRSVVRSYKPTQEFQSVYINGKAVPSGRFQAQQIREVNANECS